jgi:hypothetical protein
MFTEFAQWRRENDVDDYLDTFKFMDVDFNDLYPNFFHSTDRMGRPLFIQLAGKSKPKELL